MIQNKKGVSDVISTVLIILLVLAAVGIVGAIVLRSVGQSGAQVDRGSVCASVYFEVESCTPGASATSAIVKRVSTGGNAPILIELRNQAGGLANIITTNLPSDGSRSTTTFAATAPPTTSAYISATFANNIVCTSAVKTCA